MLHRRRLSLFVALLAGAGMHAVAQPTNRPTGLTQPPRLPRCGGQNQSCCMDRRADGTPVPSCNVGLGCDLGANRCISPCGGTGQPCCDGPDTYAPTATASPTSGLYCVGGECVSRRPMCAQGACTVATHRCTACGLTAGAACCPPDAQRGIPFCPGAQLMCRTEGDRNPTSGTCAPCGHFSEPACPGGSCGDDSLVEGPHGCEPCGRIGLLACGGGCKEGELGFEGRCVESAYCDRYAREAARGVEANVHRHCAQFGPRWHGDYASHYQWCRTAPRDAVEAERAARSKTLVKCDFCNGYASAAVEAYMTIEAYSRPIQGCQISTASRWSANFDDHFRWCMAKPEQAAMAEQNARAGAVDHCLHPPPPPSGSSGPPGPPGSPSQGPSCAYQCCATTCVGPPPPPGSPPNCTPGWQCGPGCCPH